jgi:chemotaxis protein CheY-P-specific phosphatase CheC
MTTQVLICDDSGFARKQMARSIPDGWDVEITFAEHGEQALELIRQGKGDVMFLDLNMPVMDGYETMQHIRRDDLPCLVIVVSGDVQPQARTRMIEMGALDFIRKPIDNTKLVSLLRQYGIYTGEGSAEKRESTIDKPAKVQLSEKLDAYRELVNVAMGRAGESLAKQLDEFIDLPIPNVNLIETNELQMAINEIHGNDRVSAVSKGFTSGGINGEALVIFSDANVESMARLMNYQQSLNQEVQIEALMDISNILIGACLNALSDQLSVRFSHTQPIILGRHLDLEALINNNISRWRKVLAIEIAYAIKDKDIRFDLLLLFPDLAMAGIDTRLMRKQERHG